MSDHPQPGRHPKLKLLQGNTKNPLFSRSHADRIQSQNATLFPKSINDKPGRVTKGKSDFKKNSGSRGNLIKELIHDWLHYFSTDCHDRSTEIISLFIKNLKANPDFENLFSTGSDLRNQLLLQINQYQSSKTEQPLDFLLHYYLDARAEIVEQHKRKTIKVSRKKRSNHLIEKWQHRINHMTQAAPKKWYNRLFKKQPLKKISSHSVTSAHVKEKNDPRSQQSNLRPFR